MLESCLGAIDVLETEPCQGTVWTIQTSDQTSVFANHRSMCAGRQV